MVENMKAISIEVEEEIEGEHIETSDYFFDKIGNGIPLKTDDSIFDLQSPPLQPLAVSERFGLIFVAHSSGFCVARTKDIIASAKEIKDTGSGPSIQKLCLVEVSIGRVSILALSADSSTLASCVGGEIRFFSVDSLLSKDQKPLFSCSVESTVKDMRWTRKMETSCVVLSDTGKLYFGDLKAPLRAVIDEVEAVEWSVKGNLLAVARKNVLEVLSSKLEERSRIMLPFKSWMDNMSTSGSVVVDTIRWVRSDCVILGCLHQATDGDEIYFVQVIISKDGKFSKASSKLAGIYFSDLFPGIVDDIVPFSCGPSLFMSYLENGEFCVAAHRKNTDQHVILFGWKDGNNQPSVIDIERDNWLPRIELQGNGDDNLVLGICIDKASVDENVEVKLGTEEPRELSPFCILMCLTLEGKLIMFRVASISQCQSKAASAFSDDEENSSVDSSSDLQKKDKGLNKQGTKQLALDMKSHSENAKIASEPSPERKGPSSACVSSSDLNAKRESVTKSIMGNVVADTQACKRDEQQPVSMANTNLNSKYPQSILSRRENSSEVSLRSSHLGDPSPMRSVRSSTGHLVEGNVTDTRNLQKPSDLGNSINGNHVDAAGAAGNLLRNSNFLQSGSFEPSMMKFMNMGQKTSVGSVFSEISPSIPSPKVQSQQTCASGRSNSSEANHRNLSPFGQLNSEPSTKQFEIVRDMLDDLDKLLESIEATGGFRDVCISAQRSSLQGLEVGVETISEKRRLWQCVLDKQLGEIQDFLDMIVQVLVRKMHMEKLVKQTTDKQYWDLWDRQKLNSELDLKRRNILKLSQDLINELIHLEKHFNALELSKFGESGEFSEDRRTLKTRSAPSRHIQSLRAIHSVTNSQLATAEQLSENLSKQMAALEIKSPPVKEGHAKMQLFETIGIPYPHNYTASQNLHKVIDTPSIKNHLTVSTSAVKGDSRRNSLTATSISEPETARRRRDSLDKNWANVETPKTTVKRILLQNECLNVCDSFSSKDKRLVSPPNQVVVSQSQGHASQPTLLHNGKGGYDTAKKVASENLPTSPLLQGGSSEMSPTLKILPGVNDSGFLLQSASRSSLSSSLSTSSSMNFVARTGNSLSTPERPSLWMTDTETSETVMTRERIASQSEARLSWGLTFGKAQQQLLSLPIKAGEIPIPNKQATAFAESPIKTAFAVPSDGSASLSTKPVVPVSASSPIIRSSDSLSSFPTLSTQTIQSTSIVHDSLSSFKPTQENVNSPVSLPVTSPITVASSSNALSSFMSPDAKTLNISPTGSSLKSTSQPAADKPDTVDFVPTASTSKHDFGVKAKPLETSPSQEFPESVTAGSHLALNSTTTLAHDSSQGQQASLEAVLPADSGGITGVMKFVNAAVTQEDEMEEETVETNRPADLDLGSLGGFGLGSATPVSTAKPNPFGGSNTPSTGSSFSMTVPSGSLFRPASFSFLSTATNLSVPTNLGSASSGFNSRNTAQPPAGGSGFGQLAQIGSGQQALGSVLGSFGRSRQLGTGLVGGGGGGGGGAFQSNQSTGGFPNAATGGGFVSSTASGSGFAGIASTGGGFTGVAATGGGFAGATATGGGFAGIAASGGGFSGASSIGGGFGGTASISGGFGGIPANGGGGGFAAAAAIGSGGGGFGFAGAAQGAGGFGAFSSQGSGGFSAFGGGGGRQPPSELFTQMRK